jgi:hypothetical protein
MQAEDRGILRWTTIWIPTLVLSLLEPGRPVRHPAIDSEHH